MAGVTAQARTSAKKKTTSTQSAKAVRKAGANVSSELSVRDRINQRLKDSAASAGTSVNTTASTVINGITVPAAASTNANSATSANATTGTGVRTTTSTTQSSNGSSTITGGNSVTNTGSPVQGRPIPGTIPVTPSNGANVEGKPVTQEQTKSSATDINRTQMNAINGNQAASAVQNPNNTTKNITTNLIGESQWGTNQIGENQWTPPNNIITGFTRDFPAIRGATWTRDNAMNTFSARYRAGDLWTSSTYNMNGMQVETRTEMPLTGTWPEPVTSFKGRQSAIVDLNRISRVERPGRESLYEVRLSTGRIAYINSRGEEVALQ